MGKTVKGFFTDKVTAAKDSDVPACKLKSHFRGKLGGLFSNLPDAIRFSAP